MKANNLVYSVNFMISLYSENLLDNILSTCEKHFNVLYL